MKKQTLKDLYNTALKLDLMLLNQESKLGYTDLYIPEETEAESEVTANAKGF